MSKNDGAICQVCNSTPCNPGCPKVVVVLSAKQAEKLSDLLWSTWYEGPHREGLASAEVERIREIVDDAIQKAPDPKAEGSTRDGKQ